MSLPHSSLNKYQCHCEALKGPWQPLDPFAYARDAFGGLLRRFAPRNDKVASALPHVRPNLQRDFTIDCGDVSGQPCRITQQNFMIPHLYQHRRKIAGVSIHRGDQWIGEIPVRTIHAADFFHIVDAEPGVLVRAADG